MILGAVLLISFFHHKPKPKAMSPDQEAFAKLIEQDRKIVINGIDGAKAFEDDKKFAQYERPEIDAFEHQLFVCFNDNDDIKLDNDVDTLMELGDKLMALDDALHKRYSI